MADLYVIRAESREAATRLTRRAIKRLRALGMMLAALVGGYLLLSRYADDAIDEAACSPQNYQSAVPDLIKLCQTDPALLRHAAEGIDPDIVASLGKLRPRSVTIGPNSATVNWGGSFHHAGWHLDRDADAAQNATTSGWILRFYGDGGRPAPREELTFTVPKDARFTARELAPTSSGK